ICVDRHSENQIAEDHPDDKGDEDTRNAKDAVPDLPPESGGGLAAELDRHSAEEQPRDQEHEKRVKAGKDHRVGVGKAGKKPSHHDNDPDFVAVPNRADRIEKNPSLLI